MSKCLCGSNLERTAQYDGYNIFLTYTCEKCYNQRMSEFRPDIFTQYECDEPIEEE